MLSFFYTCSCEYPICLGVMHSGLLSPLNWIIIFWVSFWKYLLLPGLGVEISFGFTLSFLWVGPSGSQKPVSPFFAFKSWENEFSCGTIQIVCDTFWHFSGNLIFHPHVTFYSQKSSPFTDFQLCIKSNRKCLLKTKFALNNSFMLTKSIKIRG